MMDEIRLTRGLFLAFRAALLSRRDVESKAYLLCGVSNGAHRTALLGRELILLGDGDYAERSPARVVTKGDFVARLLARCEHEGLSLLEAHTHPWGNGANFSGIDDRSDGRKFRATAALPAPFFHATAVFGTDMGFSARVWDRERQRARPIERLTVVGSPLEIRPAGHGRSPGLTAAQSAVYDRQVRAFGPEGQRILSGLTVAVVGCGGLGSQIALALALLGVGHLILIDPDRLEPSNANRIVAATGRHFRKNLPKVRAITESLGRLLAPPRVTALAASVREPRTARHLLDADLVVGAVDSGGVRHYLNAICACALIPYLDGGVGILAQDGRIAAAGGQVRAFLPGRTACLACHDTEAGQRAVEEHTPEQRALSERAGYVHGEHVLNPQVVFLNGVIANALAWEAVKLATGCLPVAPYVHYDLTAPSMHSPERATRRADCYVCGPAGLLGSGGSGLAEHMVGGAGTAPPPPRSRKGGEDGTDSA